MPDRETRELVTTLQSFRAFTGVGAGDLQALLVAGRVTTLPDRWTFLHDKTPADAVYVLLAGSAQVRLAGGVVVDLEPGAVLGEMALLGHSLRRADVVTTSRVRLLRVDYEALEKLYAKHPALKDAVGAVYEEHEALRRGREEHTGG